MPKPAHAHRDRATDALEERDLAPVVTGPATAPEPPSPDLPAEHRRRPRPWLQAVLLLATLVSVHLTGAAYVGALPENGNWLEWLQALPQGASYALPLMGILLTHEFGHWLAARAHDVPASLPYFLPLPWLSPFGTMGAIIAMRGRITTRKALLDIGAAGPLAGLVVALPVLVIGLRTSPIAPTTLHGVQEGQSLLYAIVKRLVVGPIPDGSDVFLSPTAFAGWCGLFITALNLLPIGQLDGGHLAYALFGPKQHRYARWVHRGMLGAFALNAWTFLRPVVRERAWNDLSLALENSVFWLIWFALVYGLGRLSGDEHPPTNPGALSGPRRAVGWLCLGLFALLFMPTPWSRH